MGEAAESLTEGIFCQGCGEYMGEGGGYPTLCDSCREDEFIDDEEDDEEDDEDEDDDEWIFEDDDDYDDYDDY